MTASVPSVVTAFIDGASQGNPGPAGAGAVLIDEAGQIVAEVSMPLGRTTNNVAEYLALVYALQAAQQHGIRRLAVKTDSELLARQIMGQYKVRDATLRLFHDLAQHAFQGLLQWSIVHIPREQNAQADRLASQAATRSSLTSAA